MAAVFPTKNSYIYSLDLPHNISTRSAEKILKINAEIALPISPNGHYRYGLVIEEEQRKARYLQFLFQEEYFPLKNEVELGFIQMSPSSIFQGFSEIFTFPNNKKCFLYCKTSETVEMTWGMNGKVDGIRSIKKTDTDQLCRVLEETFFACPKIEYFFSWCSSEDRLRLEKCDSRVKWIHLRDQKLSHALENKEESLPIISAALVHALGYRNKCHRLTPEPSSFFRNSRFRRSIFTSLFLILLLGTVFEISWLFKIRKFKAEKAFLTEQIEREFYNVFPRSTPMLDPVKQFKEKNEERSPIYFDLRPREFLKILSHLNQVRSKDIKILRIMLEAGQLKVEGSSSSLGEIDVWVRSIQNLGLKEVELQKINQRSEDGLFAFNLTINLKKAKE
jgi:hypothetical protein